MRNVKKEDLHKTCYTQPYKWSNRAQSHVKTSSWLVGLIHTVSTALLLAESWVFQYDPEIKCQNIEQRTKSSLWWKGYDPQTICAWRNNSEHWLTHTGSRRVENEAAILKEEQPIPVHDNASDHSAKKVKCFLANGSTVEISHLLYSSVLTTANFFLFCKVKTAIKGKLWLPN